MKFSSSFFAFCFITSRLLLSTWQTDCILNNIQLWYLNNGDNLHTQCSVIPALLLVVFPADHWSPSFAIGLFWASLIISEHLLRLTSLKYVESIVISAAPSHFTPHQSQQSWLLQPTSYHSVSSAPYSSPQTSILS